MAILRHWVHDNCTASSCPTLCDENGTCPALWLAFERALDTQTAFKIADGFDVHLVGDLISLGLEQYGAPFVTLRLVSVRRTLRGWFAETAGDTPYEIDAEDKNHNFKAYHAYAERNSSARSVEDVYARAILAS